MSTIITHRQFPHYHKYTMDLAGRPLTLEVGKLAELANAAVMVTYGETSVLCCVTAAARPRDGIDFFPLSVDFEEKLYAVGRIPGSFNRREGRPGEKGVLTSRVIDRPIRPLFPHDFRNDVSVMCTVMSVDHDCSPEICGLIGTSAALAISDIPWNGPVGALKVGLVDGKLVFNPTSEQRKVSDLDVTVVSTGKKVVMIEAGANQVPNDVMFEAIRMAHEENQKQVALINQMVSEIGKPKFDYPHADFDDELFEKIVNATMDEAKAAMDTDDKNVREARWNQLIEKWHQLFLEDYPEMDKYLEEITYKFQKKIVKAWLLEGHRVDGRQRNEIRPLAAEVGVLPRVHGSGLFTRGQTQVLSVATLDTLSANQKLDTIWEETEKRYMHHYNFPGYSVGEAKPARSPGRREIGHGALAERALLPVIPPVEEFPYAIRVVSEVVSSNGSTSQGSICGSTLALMDAGVPISAPVAGISCGLIQDDDGSFTTFIDIQGVEDFHGEMDFKVAGTKEGITAIQMDLKNDGLKHEIIKEAFAITKEARFQILDEVMAEIDSNVVAFPCGVVDSEILYHSTTPITCLDDIKGLKIRGVSDWANIETRLGASVVTMDGGDCYEALSRGTIDAAEYSSPSANWAAGFQEVAPYLTVPGVHQSCAVYLFLINRGVWESMDEQTQNIIKLACTAMMAQNWAEDRVANGQAWEQFKELEAQGKLTIYRMPDEDIAKIQQAADEYYAEKCQSNPLFAKIYESQQAYIQSVGNWSEAASY